MSEAPQESTPQVSGPIAKIQASIRNFFGNWKVRAGLIAGILLTVGMGVFLLDFFWNHLVAEQGMRVWSSSAGARPIECMIEDTNANGYVSCSAMLKGDIVPLECGASVFNIGCRINYAAAAAPPLRGKAKIVEPAL